MASTGSKPRIFNFTIIHGLTGGPIHSRKLSRSLQKAGFEPVKQVEQADIIIAHSAGCWLIPETTNPKLVIYVGMPLAQTNPRKTWLVANMAMLKREGVAHSLKVRAKNTYYSLRQPWRNLRITRIAKAAQPVIFSEAMTVFIANRHDPWPRSDRIKLQTYMRKYDWAFISLPGAHDSLWRYPEHYVAIINHYAGLLA